MYVCVYVKSDGHDSTAGSIRLPLIPKVLCPANEKHSPYLYMYICTHCDPRFLGVLIMVKIR